MYRLQGYRIMYSADKSFTLLELLGIQDLTVNARYVSMNWAILLCTQQSFPIPQSHPKGRNEPHGLKELI